MANTLGLFRDGVGFIDWLGFSELDRLFSVELKDHEITMSEPRWVVLSCDPEARLLKRALGVDVVDGNREADERNSGLGTKASNKDGQSVWTKALPSSSLSLRSRSTSTEFEGISCRPSESSVSRFTCCQRM